MSFSQNPVGFGKSLGKSGPRPAFSGKFKAAFPKTEVLGKPLIIKKTGLLALLAFLALCRGRTLAAMDWPGAGGQVTANFGLNEQGRPILGTVFRTEDPALAADQGELVFYRGPEAPASRLPSPLGSWAAFDHGDGILGIYSRFMDSPPAPVLSLPGLSIPAEAAAGPAETTAGPAETTAGPAGNSAIRAIPREPPPLVRRGDPIAAAGKSGWTKQKGFYFALFDRRERRWVNPSLIIAPLADAVPPQILLVQLRGADGQIVPPGQTRISQGLYSIIVTVTDTLSRSSSIRLAPHRIMASLNGVEAGSLSFETYSVRNGALVLSRNGLTPVSAVYAPYPAFDLGEAWFTRGQTTLELIARDVTGNESSSIRRVEVE
jgi:hypothetical protein